MRSSLTMACGAALLAAAAAACAASGEEHASPKPDAGGAETLIPDGGVTEDGAQPEASTLDAMCSKAGWCATALPDVDLSMRALWPLPGHAFAIAQSDTLGVKVLEWSDAAAEWKYIDDGTQNHPGFGMYAGGIWAPDENSVYYGVAPGYVYHGTRPVPPATDWSWTRQRLAHDDADPMDGYPWYGAIGSRYPALGVWGASAGDVYAWFKDTIYHWESVDGGAPQWTPEYTASDPEAPGERLFFVGAGGTSGDDLWFSGVRSRTAASCALVVRKTAGTYLRIADGIVPGPYAACAERDGALMIGGAEGWLTDIQPLAQGQFIGLKGARDVVKITANEDNSYSVARSPVPDEITASKGLLSLWSGPDDLWLSGLGLVIRGTDTWNGDGGTYQISTTALSRGPLRRPIHQVRGTSDTNLWAIGDRYALHKTNPQ